MSYIKFYCVFFLALFIVQIKSIFHCGVRKYSFLQLIIGGREAEEGQWPWHVAVMHKSQHELTYACGGTLIDQRRVLTCAHCVLQKRTNHTMPTESLLLHFGKKHISQLTEHVQTRDVARIHIHPEYSRHRNDIAVLELRLPVEFSNFVIPICLDMRVDRDLRSLVGRRGWIAGWGITQNETLASELQSASLPVVSYMQCVKDDPKLFGTILDKNMFCAGDRNGTSPGTGDSGGGMYFNEDDRWVLRGIVSFAKMNHLKQVDTSKYTVFVNVQRFLSWIEEVSDDQGLNSTANDVIKRKSEKECDRFKSLAQKRSNGICANARHQHMLLFYSLEGHWTCTGILVNEKHVLTAANCFLYNLRYRPLVVQIIGHGYFNISGVFKHPEYRISHSYDDIAIVRLESPVQLSYNLIPACLASNSTENLYDTLLSTGYKKDNHGIIQFFESDSNLMTSTEECHQENKKESLFTRGVLPAQLCVWNSDRLPASGQGSSGSPLQIFNKRTCMFTVVGIMFGGTSPYVAEELIQQQKPRMDYYTRVAYYLDWIEEIVWGEETVSPQTATRSLEEYYTEVTPSTDYDYDDYQ